MADKTPIPNRDKIVLEYLNGGVTYRQLEAKYGIDHSLINYWVRAHQGIPRDRAKEYAKAKQRKNAIAVPPPEPGPTPPAPLATPPDPEKQKLAKQLQQAQLKIDLLEEVIRIAQDEQGLELPKKSTTKLSRLWGKISK